MRPTVPQSKVPPSPSPDPAASIALVAVLFVGLVAVEYPLWTVALVATVVAAAALLRATRVVRRGRVCLPRTEICVRVVPQ